ncbi:MAG TPA: hypothetical protein VMG12_42925 [Polyangiaceae bacterium]|nr:hypothetical protein [Polyangiaceae bacterium]
MSVISNQGGGWRRSTRALFVGTFVCCLSAACSDGPGQDDEPATLEGTPVVIRGRPPIEAPASSAPAPAAPSDGNDAAAGEASSSGSAGAPPGLMPPSSEPGAEPELSFATDVWPIFNAHCGPCHESLREGGHNVGSDDVEISFASAIANEEWILRDLASGSMPPGCRDEQGTDVCVATTDVEIIRAWFAAGSPP